MKMADFMQEASYLVVNEHMGKSKNKESQKDLGAFSGEICFWCKKSGHFKKNCHKYKEFMKNLARILTVQVERVIKPELSKN